LMVNHMVNYFAIFNTKLYFWWSTILLKWAWKYKGISAESYSMDWAGLSSFGKWDYIVILNRIIFIKGKNVGMGRIVCRIFLAVIYTITY
jgi:hypothetical protein